MKKFLSLVLALVMTMSLVTISAGAKDFTDDSTINYAEAVDVMSAIGVVGGYADGSFNPQGVLTRGAAAKIICNMILGPTTAGALKADAAPYKDVAVDNTFAGYIAFCAKEGIISGYADGTFRPAASLTGYAFMKMLLGALGYDAAIEGYTGANWSINVAKRALNIGLDKGLDGEFVGSKPLNREEACLYAFNTLNADMVEYDTKGTQITINGVVIASGASEAESIKKTFAKVYFSKLHGDEDAEDAFGRSATKWTWKNKEVGTYAKTADATYTEAVKISAIYADLGLSKTIDKENIVVKVDGVKAAAKDVLSITKKDDTKIGANGELTEVYLVKDKETDEIKGAKIIQINTYIGKVSVDENDDDERIIVVDDMEYVTEEFEDDDVVLYTKAMGDKDYEIQAVTLAEKLEGKLTKISGKTKYTIDGETYSTSATFAKGEGVAAKKDVDYYLDAYGYIIKIDLATDEITVDDLAYVLATNYDKFDGSRAKLLFVDGSKKTVALDFDGTAAELTALEGTIVSFDVNDDDEYELTKVDQKTDTSVTKGTPKVAGKVANSKTVYTYYLDDKDTETYTGYKNAPSATGDVVVYYNKDNKAVAVFVIADSEKVEASSDKLTYIAVKGGAKNVTDDGDNQYYTFSAVVDGEVTELDVATSAVDKAGIVADGVYAFKTIKTNKDGIVTSLKNEKALNVLTGTDEDPLTVKTGDDIITLDGEAYAYTDDVLVLIVDDDEFDVSDVDGIKTKAGVYKTVQFTQVDGKATEAIDVIILTKK